MRSTDLTTFTASWSVLWPSCRMRRGPSWCGRYTTRPVAGSGSASRCNGDKDHEAERSWCTWPGPAIAREGVRYAVRHALRRCHEGTPVVCRSVSELVSTDVAPSTTRPLKDLRPLPLALCLQKIAYLGPPLA